MYCCEAANSCPTCSFSPSGKAAIQRLYRTELSRFWGRGTCHGPGAGFGSALDRRVAAAERDLLRLLRLGLRDADLEHAVAVVGLHLVLGDALRDADRAAEAPEAALEADEAVLGALLGALTLGGHGERVVLELDR